MAKDEVAREHQRDGEERKRNPNRVNARHKPSRHRAQPLYRMETIGLEIGDVIEKIERA